MSSDTADYATESQVPHILLGTLIPLAIATTFVFARLYSRAFITTGLEIDDAWITVSWIGGTFLTVLGCAFTAYGEGHHQNIQTAEDATVSARLSYVARLSYQFVLFTTKMGLCSFYLRVFQDRRSKIIIYLLMGFIVLFSVPLEIYVIVECRPSQVEPGNPLACDTNTPDLYISAICNSIADALLILFAMPRIVSLKIAIRQKAALLVVICLGGLVVIAAIVRLVEVLRFNMSIDRTWDFANITIWSGVEVQTGLFCASAPTIRPLLRKLSPKHFTSTIDSQADPPTNQGRSGYGNGSQRPRIYAMGDGFELSSQTDLNAGTNMVRVPNKAWKDDEESRGAH